MKTLLPGISPIPWKLEPASAENSQTIVRSADGFSIFTCTDDDPEYGRPEEERANARLCTDAPLAYLLLRMLLEELDSGSPVYPGGVIHRSARERLRVAGVGV